MPYYWVTFVGHSRPGCIQAEDAEAARSIAEAKYGEKVQDADPIPYSAFPVLHSDGSPSTGFEARCSDPYRCRGKSYCPKRPSCSE